MGRYLCRLLLGSLDWVVMVVGVWDGAETGT